jgi:glycosyltransferase involved in cell wall biosynthesis
MILFLAHYPDERTRYEGMSQRVIAIDKQYEDKQRIYLFVSYRLFFKKQVIRIDPMTVQYRCNIFVHFFFILRLFSQAGTLYFHSVINVLPVLPMLRFIRANQHVVLDAHGLVPEEQRLAGTRWKSALYERSERCIFGKADVVITVNSAMERHFREKYPAAKLRYMVLPIMPDHLRKDDYELVSVSEDEQIRVVYSGNTQLWQNVDLMIKVIKANSSERMRYDLLTGEPELMKRYLANAGLADKPNIHVRTVAPSELKTYYRAAHYGFMMRGDINVSRASCPTKMIEYMYYGIIPIIVTRKIGDFDEMGFESVLYQEFSEQLGPRKSLLNNQIIAKLIENEPLYLADLRSLVAPYGKA